MSDQLAATNLSVLNNPDQSNLVRLPQDIFKKASAYFDKKEVEMDINFEGVFGLQNLFKLSGSN